MNIQIASDWHLEFRSDRGKSFLASLDPAGVDVLVLAGDAQLVKHAVGYDMLCDQLCAKYPEVILVPGNHDFFGSEPEAAWRALKQLEITRPNLHALRNEILEIEGQRFVGGTLWYPAGYPAQLEWGMCDFQEIQGFKPWVFEEHQRFLDVLEHAGIGDVVVTHHMPSFRSISERFKGSALNAFFAVNLNREIYKRRPRLWIHGHTHDAQDYTMGATRILCNPLGYPHELNTQYREKLLFTV